MRWSLFNIFMRHVAWTPIAHPITRSEGPLLSSPCRAKPLSDQSFRVRPKQPRPYEFPLPPLDEQKRIAEILWAADEAFNQHQQSNNNLMSVKNTLLNRLTVRGIGHHATQHTRLGEIPVHWRLATVEDVTSICQYGLSIPLNESGQYPILRMMNYDDGRIIANDLTYVDLDDAEFNTFKVHKGDILFNRTNSADLVGKVGILDLEGDYVFASYLVRLRADENQILPDFLNYYLNSGSQPTKGGINMATPPIANAFARHWWVLLIRGILAVLFGIMAFVLPGVTLVTLVLLYGVYALADGVTALWVGGRARAWSLVLGGILGVLIGIFTFIYPGIAAIALLYLIAAWAIVRGIFEIITAIQLRKEISNEWALIIGGILSILFGVVLVVNPAAGALAMIWVIGIYALIFGLLMIVLAFRVRGLPQRFERPSYA
jgi:uncharacterized membrane protein HdeD (DUF308 family)